MVEADKSTMVAGVSYPRSMSPRKQGSRIGGASARQKSMDNNESRDDGEKALPSSIDKHHAYHPRHRNSSTNPHRSTSNHRHSSRQNSGHHRSNDSGETPWNSVQIELLRAERERLLRKLGILEAQVESVQKRKAYEKSTFEMQRGQLMVEIEGLQEDKSFLLKKRDGLNNKLLDMHMKRLSLMENEDAGAILPC